MAPPVKKGLPTVAVLPQKERGLFARLIQEYETKKYKTGLKTADTILKKFPEHGETICMKGLLLASLGRKEEGLDLAKQGVRFDLTSFIAWHALGILNRMSKNYQESVKCYLQALKIEGGNNVNLIRESAYLYIQLRDWTKAVETRSSLVRIQPHLRMNWIGLAVALHLGQDYTEALRVLEQFEQIHRDIPKRSYEQSELYLYHAQVLFEAKRGKEAVEYLDKKSDSEVLDWRAADVLRAKCWLQLDDRSAAERTYESLIKRNQEDRSYLHGWLTAKGISAVAETDEDRAQATEAFGYLKNTYPKSRAVKRLALVYAQGNSFRKQAKAYIGTALQKGVPSIFTDVKSLYGDDEKRRVVEEIVETFRAAWEGEEEAPSSYLWAVYFLAQHYSYLRQSERALAYINSAIAHSPTMPELHMTRARILKRAGALLWASQAMEDARLIDGQDRFLNSKSAKYYLRIGKEEEARQRMGLFTKPDAPSPVYDLIEMQATWYLLEEEKAFRQKGGYAMALKRCNQIDKIFTEIWDDQLDFHSYCLRKSTLRAYVNMVRFEDILQSHPVYFHAATDAITMYLRLHDNPSLLQPEEVQASNGLSKEEKKKAAQKARKQEIKAQEEAKKAAAAAAKQKSKDKNTEEEDAPLPVADEDPDGELAFAEVKPLRDAQKFLSVLQQMAPRQIQTWLLTFEVAFRERNWLLATKALAHAHKLDRNNAQLHVQLIALKLVMPSLQAAPEAIGKSIEQVLTPILPADVSLAQFNTMYVQANPSRAEATLAGAKANAMIDADRKGDAIASILEIPKRAIRRAEDGEESSAFHCSLATLCEGKDLLQQYAASTDVLQEFTELCSQAYPLADEFKSQLQRNTEETQRLNEKQAWAFSQADGEAQPAKVGEGDAKGINGHAR